MTNMTTNTNAANTNNETVDDGATRVLKYAREACQYNDAVDAHVVQAMREVLNLTSSLDSTPPDKLAQCVHGVALGLLRELGHALDCTRLSSEGYEEVKPILDEHAAKPGATSITGYLHANDTAPASGRRTTGKLANSLMEIENGQTEAEAMLIDAITNAADFDTLMTWQDDHQQEHFSEIVIQLTRVLSSLRRLKTAHQEAVKATDDGGPTAPLAHEAA